MAKTPFLRSAIVSLMAWFVTGRLGLHAQLTQEMVARAKEATGLLIDSEGSGTAFCISESGLFVTCDHVVENAKAGSLAIVLNPAGKQEKRYPAKVLRRIKEADLALLKVEFDHNVPFLELADDAKLFETQQLCALGYPFGKLLAADEKSYPSISVNLGHITSLRQAKGVLEAIQLDAMLNVGNSGGPVLDEKGAVVGVVSSGVPGSGVNFATPISRLKTAIDTPMVTVDMPRVAFEKRFDPADFAISVEWIQAPVAEPAISLELTADGKTRQAVAQKGKDGKYHASLAPAGEKPAATKTRMHVVIDFPGGRLTGEVEDTGLTLEGKARALASIGVMEKVKPGNTITVDGKTVAVPAELGKLIVDLGGVSLTVDARAAKRIELTPLSQEGLFLTTNVVIQKPGGGATNVPGGSLTIDAPADVAKSNPTKGAVPISDLREIKLASPVTDVVAGGDGRLLILYLKDVRKLAVFDVAELTMRGYISVASDPVFFAGGSRHLLVFYPEPNIIQRYSLETLERERTVTNPMSDVIAMVMGCSSPRHAFFICSSENRIGNSVQVFDVEKMAVVAKENGNRYAQLENRMWVRVSEDGRTVGCTRIGSSPSGFIVLTYKAGTIEFTYEHESPGILVPNADGSQIFTSHEGIYTPKYVSVFKLVSSWTDGVSLIPSYEPNYFLGVPFRDPRFSSSSKKQSPKSVVLYAKGSNDPLVTLPDQFSEMGTNTMVHDAMNLDPMTLDKRYHFYPQLGRIITIPPTNDKLVVRPIDIRKILEERGVDYLYVTSSAPVAKAGQPFQYKLEAASKSGGVRYSLQSGPEKLTINPDGMVKWVAPFAAGEETVIVELKDSSGQELLHTFQITVLP